MKSQKFCCIGTNVRANFGWEFWLFTDSRLFIPLPEVSCSFDSWKVNHPLWRLLLEPTTCLQLKTINDKVLCYLILLDTSAIIAELIGTIFQWSNLLHIRVLRHFSQWEIDFWIKARVSIFTTVAGPNKGIIKYRDHAVREKLPHLSKLSSRFPYFKNLEEIFAGNSKIVD